MNRTTHSPLSVAAVAAATLTLALGAGAAHAQEETRTVAGGGVLVEGWMGQIDAAEAGRGATIESARLAMDGEALHVTTGPAVAYWSTANTASGNYTVSATFTEPMYMNLNNHPHPYGIFIAGNDMGSDQQSYLYCAAYGTGTFIVRGFGPDAFQVNGRRGEANDAVNKAAGPGEPVTQEIAVSVTDDSVSCAINGTVVGTYPKSELVTEGRLKSTDGMFGVRFAHNTEGLVRDLRVTGM
ncbi:MAG TPA: hypothetical protein VGA70_01695 [Longimicrobiales bacterium]|jgi:hypothetical protein